jgi:3-oxoacyl-[acyl-carrier protein] reductase
MKADVANFTKSLALVLAYRRIRVNCVAPDMIDTKASLNLGKSAGVTSEKSWHPQPLPDAGGVKGDAGAIIFLASDLARFTTGTSIHVDGGDLASGGWRQLETSGRYVV